MPTPKMKMKVFNFDFFSSIIISSLEKGISISRVRQSYQNKYGIVAKTMRSGMAFIFLGYIVRPVPLRY